MIRHKSSRLLVGFPQAAVRDKQWRNREHGDRHEPPLGHELGQWRRKPPFSLFSRYTRPDLLSVQAGHRLSEPQIFTAQLVDAPAAHQLHVAFDFGSEIIERLFNAGLTRGRQRIQIKSPSRTRLR